jgi:hypothetical protein
LQVAAVRQLEPEEVQSRADRLVVTLDGDEGKTNGCHGSSISVERRASVGASLRRDVRTLTQVGHAPHLGISHRPWIVDTSWT